MASKHGRPNGVTTRHYLLTLLTRLLAQQWPQDANMSAIRAIRRWRVLAGNARPLSTAREGDDLVGRFRQSIREMEASIGYDREAIRANMSKSMPSLSKWISDGTRSVKVQLLNTKSELNLHGPDSGGQGETDSLSPLSPFLVSPQYLRNLQQQEEWDWWPSETHSTGRPLHSVLPSETFWILAITSLINARLFPHHRRFDLKVLLSDTGQCSLRQYVFRLLNIAHLIREGANTRVDSGADDEPGGKKARLVRGNFLLYNVTYNLMRLNMASVTELMSDSLRDLTQVGYWLDQHCHASFHHSARLSDTLLGQLAGGHLVAHWHRVVAMRDASLLANACQCMAYLLGKEPQSEQYRDVHRLASHLAYVLSLLDDYYCLKHHYPLVATQQNLKHWNTGHYLRFILRLPVLLHLQESQAEPQPECAPLVLQVRTTRMYCPFSLYSPGVALTGPGQLSGQDRGPNRPLRATSPSASAPIRRVANQILPNPFSQCLC